MHALAMRQCVRFGTEQRPNVCAVSVTRLKYYHCRAARVDIGIDSQRHDDVGNNAIGQRMNLRKLEYFLSVAKLKSMTAAASELALAQPTLTKTIHALEQQLKVPLFERLPRGVELTPYGESLFRHAQALHAQAREALSEIESLRDGEIGHVAIGAEPVWVRRLLPLAVARTLAANSRVKVRVDSGYDGALLQSLRRGDLDLVVAEIPSSDRAHDFDVQPLTSDNLAILCRDGHPLAARRSVALNQLLEFVWAMPSRSSRLRRRLVSLFDAAGMSAPEMVVETNSKTFLLEMLRESDALTFAAHKSSTEHAGLTALCVEGLCAKRETGIISRRGTWLSPAAAVIITEIKNICAETQQY